MDFLSIVKKAFVRLRGRRDDATGLPICQRCGSAMRYKEAGKGRRERVWCCTNYPLCDGAADPGSSAFEKAE